LEGRYESTKTIQVLDSLANLAFEYKDWETSMNYGQKAVELQPTAKRHFLLGGAAGFRALEASVFSSLKYINIMKPAFEEAARLEPSITLYLRAQVDVLVALPSLLGGDLEGALKIIEKIKFIDPLEGLLAEGSFYEKTKDRARANEIYQRVFEFLEQTYPRCSELFFDYLKNNRRDLAYDLGRIAADYNLSPVWGQCALSYFEETHRLRDTVPLAWVYYQRARLAKRNVNEKEMERYLKKSLAISKAYPELKNLIKTVR
jgi:tetratricopeptide (TPR) repeat protein